MAESSSTISEQDAEFGAPPALDYLRAVWAKRRTLLFLFLREFKARYRHAHLGYVWAILQPLALMLVLTLVFRLFPGLPTDVPYPLFAFLNVSVWGFHAGSLTAATNALLSNGALVKRVYFPRALLPIAVTAGLFVDLLVSLAGVLVLSLVIGAPLPPAAVLVVVPLLWQALLSALLAMGASMLTVYFRDVRHVITVALQVWMFASPVIYPLSLVPEPYRAVYMLNPMAGLLGLYDDVVLRGHLSPLASLVPSLLSTFVLGALSLRYFLRHDRSCVDLL